MGKTLRLNYFKNTVARRPRFSGDKQGDSFSETLKFLQPFLLEAQTDLLQPSNKCLQLLFEKIKKMN
jgi:hypothetical protein